MMGYNILLYIWHTSYSYSESSWWWSYDSL